MISKTVKIRTIDDVKNFVQIASGIDGNIDLGNGRYIVDGKSILGVFSLDLMQPVQLRVYSDTAEQDIEKFSDFFLQA